MKIKIPISPSTKEAKPEAVLPTPGSATASFTGAITPVAETAGLMPKHGTVSTRVATKWEDSLATGNGRMGALLAGDPQHEILIVNHADMWLPLGSRECVPDVGTYLAEMRTVIAEKGYDAAQAFFETKAKEQGWGGEIVWTDPFHPACFVTIDQPSSSPIKDYARIEDFSTGEVWAQWTNDAGSFAHRTFISRPDQVIAVKLTAPKGRLSCTLQVPRVDNDKIDSTVVHSKNLITLHNVYVKGKGGYDIAMRVAASGGTLSCDGKTIAVAAADHLTLLIRVEPWKAGETGTLVKLTTDLTTVKGDYESLLKSHAMVHGGIFKRASLDLGGLPAERGMSSEAILDLAGRENRLPAALLERMYDAGRYVYMCSASAKNPPNLFGIWTGTWKPAWSGDYTLDTNIQLDIESAYSGNMAECMEGYFYKMEQFTPEFRINARNLYGCRGIFAGCRASNTGLCLHWGNRWPGQFWMPGAGWLAHWFYDHYQYTGDKTFLRERAVPFMKECALFYEDFLFLDASGMYRFSPSFSAENGSADNSSQDISICRELLTNLIAACETLDIEPDGVKRWEDLLAKLPPYLINAQGQLKEWAVPNKGENNNHRHLMHLYGAFEWPEFSEEADATLFAAAKVALLNRIAGCKERATHGHMHMGLAATGLGLGNEAYGRLEIMATLRSMYPSMVTGHEPGPGILCDDGNGSIPEIVNRMLVQSQPGTLHLLPAIPDALPKGTLSGTRARGQIAMDKVAWDMKAGSCEAVITADIEQKIRLIMPRDMEVKSIACDGKALAIVDQGVAKRGANLVLPKSKTVTVVITFKPTP
jgi:alpha-L-fucosidase 2